jgi:hypothetical protein
MTLVDQCVNRVLPSEHRKTKSDLTNACVPAGTFGFPLVADPRG